MTYQRPLPLSAAFPPSAPPGAPPPEAGPPGTAPPFAGLLQEQSTARTAPAEGDKKKGPQATPAGPAEGTATTAPASETPAEAPSGETATGEPTAALAGSEAAVTAAIPTAVPTSGASAATAGAASGTTAGETATGVEVGPATLSGGGSTTASQAGGPAAASPSGPPTASEPATTIPTEPPPANDATTDVDGPKNHDIADFSAHQQGADGASHGSIALPTGAQVPEATGQRPEASFPATPKAAAAESPAPRTPDAGKEGAGDRQPAPDDGRSPEAQAQAQAPARPAPTLPTGAPSVSAATSPTTPAALAPAPASPAASVAFTSPAPSPTDPSPTAPAPTPSAALEATLRMAGERGITRARVTLRPAELGGVEVFLREGSAGLSATVVAETPHAARMLEASATDLQRRLAAQGLELGSLQVSVGGESTGAAHGGRDQQGAGTPSGGARGAEAEATAEQTQTIDLGGGVLVDVLA
jgi:flagellar hook-length control protein FliK